MNTFEHDFQALTGHLPFPWQQSLYDLLTTDCPDNIPTSCNLPTGLGKTSVIAVWLIALAHGANVPRRLVYVVNRRTVVDQTTEEVERYRDAKAPGIPDYAVSTLRGQFADNREWSEDPSRPAVICGTVDMIGSRLLFSGYGVGMKARPLHAGFLGQDVLLVHDEAHLEPAFQKLIETIRDEQTRCREFGSFRVMELTATSRGHSQPFGLTDKDRQHPTVRERIGAKKAVHLHELAEPKKLADRLIELAKTFEDKNRAVVVFTRTVDDVLKIVDKLPKGRVLSLTGTMRGCERDGLVETTIFQRFLPGGQSDAETVYLVCTSAGEVGVNISADHLVCDLSTFESMAQRFGRVNRFGKRTDTEIHIVHPKEFEDDEYDRRRAKTLDLVRSLNADGSPEALGNLDSVVRQAAFAPLPVILPATDMLFDAWALTTIRGQLPGRPKVEPYLHGLADWAPPETQFAWRDEVQQVLPAMYDDYPPDTLLELYPLRPKELLREPSYRAFKHLEQFAKRHPDTVAWLVDDDGTVQIRTLKQLADKDDKTQIDGRTVVLPPSVGGLKNGMLDGSSTDPVDDVSETDDRRRSWADEAPEGMRRCLTIEFGGSADEKAKPDRVWYWYVARNEGDTGSRSPVTWQGHVDDVVSRTKALVQALPLDDATRDAIIFAAEHHDDGKRRKLFQTVLGNSQYPTVILAKSGARSKSRIKEIYRHEFGSLLDVVKRQDFQTLTADQMDLVLHLIATHHGRGRPHFPTDEVFDPERPHTDSEAMAVQVVQRFARLQRKYGRWGLAYLESLLRAADWAASANPSQGVME